MPETSTLLLIIGISYLLGAIPTSVWVCKWLRGIDIRTVGSGNAGATNVYRIMGIKVALGVGLVDFLKGLTAIQIAEHLVPGNESILIISGVSAIFGHIFTVFAGFKGGKGILVALGVFISLAPCPALSSFAVWGVVVYWKKYVSLASITACCTLPAFTYFYRTAGLIDKGISIQVFTIALAVLIVITHIKNIKRLLNGTENKIGKKTT